MAAAARVAATTDTSGGIQLRRGRGVAGPGLCLGPHWTLKGDSRLWVLHVCFQSSSVRKLEVGWQDGLILMTVTPVIQRIGIGNCIVDLVNFINIQVLPHVLLKELSTTPK